MSLDPLGLNHSAFARYQRRLAAAVPRGEAVTLGPEPPHPLRSDPAIGAVVQHLEEHTAALHRAGSGCAYFRYNEGLELRLEILVKLILNFVRAHPEVLRPSAKRRTRKQRGRTPLSS